MHAGAQHDGKPTPHLAGNIFDLRVKGRVAFFIANKYNIQFSGIKELSVFSQATHSPASWASGG